MMYPIDSVFKEIVIRIRIVLTPTILLFSPKYSNFAFLLQSYSLIPR